MSDISVDREKCILCEACVETCPVHIFSMADSGVQVRHEKECMACGHCVAVCPVEAVIHKGLDLSGFFPAPKGLAFSPESLYSFLRSRRSCRVHEIKPVPREMLERLIDIARYAPTGFNRQNFEFIVVQDKARVDRLSRMAATYFATLLKEIEASPETHPFKKMINEFRRDQEYLAQGKDRIFRGAPVVILVHAAADIGASLDNCLYSVFHMVLMAETLGLATCINRRFIVAVDGVPEIAKELGVPAGHKILGCVTVGFPKHKFNKLPARKPPKVRWL